MQRLYGYLCIVMQTRHISLSCILVCALFIWGGQLLGACSAAKAPVTSFINGTLDTACFNKLTLAEEKQLYNTKVDVIGKHLSGLLFIKRFPDNSVRTVFSNEMGIKFFDFEFRGDKDSTLYCMPKLNKKYVIKTLKKDLRQAFFIINQQQGKSLITDSLGYFSFVQNAKETINYTATPDCIALKNSLYTKEGKQLVSVNYSGLQSDSIFIQHHTFDMTISLKRIVQMEQESQEGEE